MNHLKNYLGYLKATNPDVIQSIESTVGKIIPDHVSNFSFKEHLKGMLLGEVQSGKTGQILGLISASADEGFEIFILLTTDNVYLHGQTLERSLKALTTFNVCGENDELRFNALQMRQPVLVVLKKNTNILKKWKNNLASSGYCKGRPIFIVDDEADAASLNTEVNHDDQSAINGHLEDIVNLSTSSMYLQVTATPQSILLQTIESGWKPSFVHYFPPGKGYLGGSFFYSDPESYVIRSTGEDELSEILETGNLPEGLQRAIETFLVTATQVTVTKSNNVCNCLIHPSVRIEHHNKIADKARLYLGVLQSEDSDTNKTRLKEAWIDLQKSKPDILPFEELYSVIRNGLKTDVILMNSSSESSQEVKHDVGINIIVGGNSLGRGVTFKGLQTVYYCRKAKAPQADTFWQHSRMFGYDRDSMLMRVLLPPSLWKMYTELSTANMTLVKQILDEKLENIHLLFPPGIKPTRRNVIKQDDLNVVVGGVNYFSSIPNQDNATIINPVLDSYSESEEVHMITLDEMEQILLLTASDDTSDWPYKAYINCIRALIYQRVPNIAKLIVRRNRNIGSNTGTLLSPDDRRLGDINSAVPVLTMYKIVGSKDKGWNGKPFWIPNIKFPSKKVFYKTN